MKSKGATPEPESSRYLDKMAERLFPDEAERAAFKRALQHGVGSSQAILMLKEFGPAQTFPVLKPYDWQPSFVLRLQDGFRPGVHPGHDAGAFYCLDMSSVFAASALSAIESAPSLVLDMCSSPGGKGIFAYRAFADHPVPALRQLVFNEVIRKRTVPLISNLQRCSIPDAMATSWDPSMWSKVCPDLFDLILVDAPCSGQSLLAKGIEVPGCFHPNMISMNASRQRRILIHAAKALAPGGHLLYMTCTFSPEENEKNVEWLLRQDMDLSTVDVKLLDAYRSPLTESHAYRLYPQSEQGAGAFASLLKRAGESDSGSKPFPSIKPIWQSGDPPRKPRNSPNVNGETKNAKKRKDAQNQSLKRHRRRRYSG